MWLKTYRIFSITIFIFIIVISACFRARDQKGWAPAMFLREIAQSDSRQQDRDPDRSEVLRERMVETIAGLYG